MKLVEQSHEILNISSTPLKDIERAGRTCYKSEDQITGESAEKFVAMLRDRGHHAMLEFGYMTVRFITNRGVTHELVRHRLCSFAQESTRYCNYGRKDMEFIKPVWLDFNACPECFNRNIGTLTAPECEENAGEGCYSFLGMLYSSEYDYKNLLSLGWTPQQAREVLPNALKTEIVVMANLREWRHIFEQRCAIEAHPQMRALMRPLLSEVKKKIPVLYDDLFLGVV